MRFASLHPISLCLAATLALLSATPAIAAQEMSLHQIDISCGAAPRGHPVKGRRDYRLMLQNEKDLRDVKYHEHFHIEPARKQLRTGNISRNVMNNLHFVLQKVPNDHSALPLLVQWDKAGGKDKNYAPPTCYLSWARQFAPDDPTVWAYSGYLYYQKKQTDLAVQLWEQALVLDPANADVNYSLGLLRFEQGRYDEARTHANTAYTAGYPLPGLRDKLRGVGQWQDAPQTAKQN